MGRRMSHAAVPSFLAVWLSIHAIVIAATKAISIAQCSTGAQLANALANPAIADIQLQTDITLNDSDWRGFVEPIEIARNLTIYSKPEQPVLLDMAYVRSKVCRLLPCYQPNPKTPTTTSTSFWFECRLSFVMGSPCFFATCYLQGLGKAPGILLSAWTYSSPCIPAKKRYCAGRTVH